MNCHSCWRRYSYYSINLHPKPIKMDAIKAFCRTIIAAFIVNMKSYAIEVLPTVVTNCGRTTKYPLTQLNKTDRNTLKDIKFLSSFYDTLNLFTTTFYDSNYDSI